MPGFSKSTSSARVVSVVLLLAIGDIACGADAVKTASAPSDRGAGVRKYAIDALTGEPRHRDVARALALFGVECDRGDLRACVERGLTLEIYDGRASALGESMRLYEDACRRATKTACADATAASSNAADATRSDIFTKRDSCEKSTVEMLACYNYAELLSRGVVTAPDEADAAVLKKRACDAGIRRACS